MEQNYLSRAAKYLADLRKRKAWRKVVSGMGAVVVFCTVYALILPALTWARPVTCGQEEHVGAGADGRPDAGGAPVLCGEHL